MYKNIPGNKYVFITVTKTTSPDLVHVDGVTETFCTTIEFFTIGLSDAFLSDLKLHSDKINFVKNCPQNSQPPDHQSHALLTEASEESVGDV